MLLSTLTSQKIQRLICIELAGPGDSVIYGNVGHLGLAINFITDDDKDNFMKIE